ncbi:G8 domain-containing protein [Haloferax larsenii]|uniref:G8 domain-containing protein n=1 Tax=Haloferax larsenii TaxID=302484 RepID=UPI001FCDFA67|nr:G8 domain-containing protein [Haloferax larsenii]
MERDTHQRETSKITERFSRRRFLQGTTAALATSAVMGQSAAQSSEESTPELWSDPETWGGSTPSAGDEVTIESGKHVLLDQNTTNLGGVTVHGVLEFKDGAYRELTSEYLLAEGGGVIRIGTEDEPFQSKAVITLTGSETDESIRGSGEMAIGTKLFGTFDGGIIDIHGAAREKTDWTKLGASVNEGDQQIQLTESVNWDAGDEIVLAPSGTDPTEAERRTIASVDGDTVELDSGLDHDHFGELQEVEGRTVDMRAEVGLLTRNVVMRGSNEVSNPGGDGTYENPTKGDTSLEYETGFGAHGIFAKDPKRVQIEGMEIYHAGQTGHKARYPLHFHHANEQPDSYISNNSVHDSYQRGYNSHGTGSVTYERNVGYDINGHCFLVEEGLEAEQNNVFRENLVVFNRRVRRGDRPFGGRASASGDTNEQNDFRPAAFWISNPNNVLEGNHAAGGYLANGFFYDGRGGFEVDTDDVDITFRNNTAHTYSADAALRYKNLARGFGVFIQLFPDGAEQFPDFPITPEHSLEGLTAYNNGHSAVWTEWSHTTLESSVLADFRVGHFALGGSTTRDNLFVGSSDNPVGRGGGRDFFSTSDSEGSDASTEDYDDAVGKAIEEKEDGEAGGKQQPKKKQNGNGSYNDSQPSGDSVGVSSTSRTTQYYGTVDGTGVLNDTLYYRDAPSNEANEFDDVNQPIRQRVRALEVS